MKHIKNNKSVKIWLWSGVVLVIAMVIIGGITRLTGSGLSIVEWKIIGGTIPPLSNKDWEDAFIKYQQFPEYQKLKSGMTLAGFKSIFWWEYFHRLLGRAMGLTFIIPFIFFLIKKRLSKATTINLLVIMALGGLQGAMGWIMVKSGLSDIPHVSHYKLAMHLGLAFLLLATILWTLFNLDQDSKKTKRTDGNLKISYLSIIVLSLQIILGAFLAGLKGGFSYNTYPLMEGKFFPSNVYSSMIDLVESGPVVQFIHRWLAFVVAGLIAFLFYSLKKYKAEVSILFTTKVLLFLVLFQLLLGIATLIYRVPIVLGAAHQFVAILLFIFLVKLIHQLSYSKS